jgi:hypothetical protein
MCAPCDDAQKHKNDPKQQDVQERRQYASSKYLVAIVGWHRHI